METNGHTRNGHAHPPPDLDALREQVEAARLTGELRRLEAETKLLESLYPGAAVLDWVDWWPDRFGTTGGSRDWLPTPNSRTDRADGHNRPFVFSELDLDWMRSQARWLAGKNPLAQGALRTLTNFTVRKGYAWECRPEKEYEADPTAVVLARQAQSVLDEFHDLNGWSQREREAFSRSRRDGETFLRHFAQGDGTTLVRPLDSEQVRQPPDYPPNWSYGVHTRPDDVETVLSYAVTYDATRPDNWDEVSAEEVSHLKLNVDSCVKRGLSDFYSTSDAFDGTWKLLRNMREAGAIQAAIAWVEQFDNTSQAALDRHVSGVKDLNRREVAHPLTGRTTPSQRMEPGTVVKVGGGRSYLPAPLAGNTTQHVAIVQACLRAVGARWNMPEFLISADASNANYSSTLVAGSPFVTSVECEQEVYGLYFLRSQWIALKNACAAGRIRLPDGSACPIEMLQAYIDVHYTPPQVAIADVFEEARVDHLDIAAGVMSLQTRRNRRDLDSDQERANMASEPPTRVTGRVVDIDAQGNPVAPQGVGPGGQTGAQPGQLAQQGQPAPVREAKDALGHGSEKHGGSHPHDDEADDTDADEAREAWQEYDADHAEWEKECAQIEADHAAEMAAHEKETARLTTAHEAEKTAWEKRAGERDARRERAEAIDVTAAFDRAGGFPSYPDPVRSGDPGYSEEVESYATGTTDTWDRAFGETGYLAQSLAVAAVPEKDAARVGAVADKGKAAVERAVGKYRRAVEKHDRAMSAALSHRDEMLSEPDEPDEPDHPGDLDEDATPEERAAYPAEVAKYEADMAAYGEALKQWEKEHAEWEAAEEKQAELEEKEQQTGGEVQDAVDALGTAWDEAEGKIGEAVAKVQSRLTDALDAEEEADPEPDEPDLPDEPDSLDESDYPDEPEEPDVERPPAKPA